MIGPSSFDDKPDHTCPANAGPRSPRTTSRLQETGKGRGVARGEHQAGKTLLCPIPPTSTISAGPSTKAHPAKWRVFPDVRPLAIDDTIQEAIDNHAIVDFSLSGGKDSAAAAIAVSAWLDKRRHPVDLRSATHAHLGVIEWPETIDHIKNLTEKLAIPLSIVSQEKGLIDRWRRRFEAAKLRYAALECYHLIGPFSSASLRFCTSEMKTSPIRRSLSLRNPGATVISVIGVRADESPRRANAPISSIDQLPSDRSPRPKLISWNPIKDWTAQDVFDAHHAARVPLHYAYTRHAMTRLSCAFCVLASRADVENAAKCDVNAEAYRQITDLEISSTFAFQPTRWLADTNTPQPIDRAQLERAKRLNTIRRALEDTLPPDLRYIKGWPPRIPNQQEARLIADVRSAILAHHELASPFQSPSAVIDRFAELHLRNAPSPTRRTG